MLTKHLVGGLILFVLLCIILSGFYQYRINPDGISYLNIAHNYITWNNPINGFWGPLVSWLIVPLLLLHIPSLLSFKIVMVLIGTLTLNGLYKLTQKLPMTEQIRNIILFVAIPILLFYTFAYITPDLLLLCLLVYYLNEVLSPNRNGVLIGILGAFAYFSKGYAFYFFIVHFPILMILLKDKANLFKGLLTFMLISGVWICLISFHYGHFTIATTGSYNLLLSRPTSLGDPMLYQGLIKPLPNATSSWDDPTFLHLETKPVGLAKEVLLWGEHLFKNVLVFGVFYEGFTISAVFILGFYLLRIKDKILPFTIVLYTLGYLPDVLEERYIWFPSLILLLMAGVVCSLLSRKKILIFLIFISFIIFPIKRLITTINADSDAYEISRQLTDFKGNIASDSNWNKSLYIAYYIGDKYYGATSSKGEKLVNELKTNNIKYFFVWDKSLDFPPVKKIDNLTIYKF